MNILLLTFSFYPEKGGISHTINSMCKFFNEKDHTFIVLNPNYNGKNIHNLLIRDQTLKKEIKKIFHKKFLLSLYIIIKNLFRKNNIPLLERLNLILYLFLKPKILIRTVENFQKFYPFLQKTNFNLIVTADCGFPLVLGLIISKTFNKKIVSLAHGIDFQIENYFSLKYFYLKNTDFFILSNIWLKKLFQKIYDINDKKIDIINRGMFLEDYFIEKSKETLRIENNIPIDKFLLLSVGRQNKRKNYQLVIRAIRKIKDIRLNFNGLYYLIGEGDYTSNLKHLVIELDLSEDIKFLGILENKKRNEFYKMSDIFLMPSLTEKNDVEGFGIVFLEANYYKVPVIGSTSGGIVEAIKDGENGILVNPRNLDDIVNKILYLYDNKDQRIKMGEIGHQRVIKDYDWTNIGKKYEKTFKKAINF